VRARDRLVDLERIACTYADLGLAIAWTDGLKGQAGASRAGEGRYLIVPPALHPTGAIYRFKLAPWETKIAELPLEVYEAMLDGATSGWQWVA
jgi:hypothetical protein